MTEREPKLGGARPGNASDLPLPTVTVTLCMAGKTWNNNSLYESCSYLLFLFVIIR